jgi:hypothetical protein
MFSSISAENRKEIENKILDSLPKHRSIKQLVNSNAPHLNIDRKVALVMNLYKIILDNADDRQCTVEDFMDGNLPEDVTRFYIDGLNRLSVKIYRDATKRVIELNKVSANNPVRIAVAIKIMEMIKELPKEDVEEQGGDRVRALVVSVLGKNRRNLRRDNMEIVIMHTTTDVTKVMNISEDSGNYSLFIYDIEAQTNEPAESFNYEYCCDAKTILNFKSIKNSEAVTIPELESIALKRL